MTFHINKISSIIYNRRSSKIFKEKQEIPMEDLLSFFEAARWAPSARNRQPWRYLLFTDQSPDALALIRSCLDEKNQVWANKAPVLILSCAEITDAQGTPNRSALHDLGLANENLLLQIRSLNYNCRPMGGFDKEKAKVLFNIPENIQPFLVIAVGLPVRISSLPQEMQEIERQPRERNEMQTWVHLDQWGKLDLPN